MKGTISTKTLLISATLLMALVAMPASAYSTCTFTVRTMDFGNYDPSSAVPLDTNSRIRITCTNEPALVADISFGASGTGGMNPWEMTSAAPTVVLYGIYTAADYAVVWGDGSGGTSTVQLNIGGKKKTISNLDAYGRIPPMQSVMTGLYTDTVTLTINW